MKVDPTVNIPTKSSTADVWIEWYKALQSNLGSKWARTLFVMAWQSRGGTGSPANTVDFRKFLKDKGVVIDESGLSSIADTVSGIGDFFGDIMTAGKWITISIIIIALGGAAMMIFNIARRPERAIAAASPLAMGRRMGGY